MGATVAELDILFNADTSQAQSAFAMVQDTMFRTAIAGQKMGGPIVDTVKDWIGSAIDLETQMNNVNSIAKVNSGVLQGWTDDVQNMAVTWGQGSVDTAEGLYQIQSAGFSAADGIQILESSSQAARAGLSTVEVASDAVTTVMKAYENQIGSTAQAYQNLTSAGERAEYVQNVLFRGVDRGKVTYDQLAGAIGNSIASAATAGVNFEETTAAIALMTQQGLSADEASTALNNTLLAFINPGEKMQEVVAGLGYESALTMLQTEGLTGSMELLEKATGGNADQIAELFTNIRSRRGAMLLMNGDLRAMTDAMYDAQGGADKLSAMQSALAEQTKSTSFAIDVMQASIEVMGQELVQAFLPAIRFFANLMAEFAKAIIDLPQPIKTFIGALVALFGVFASGVGAVALFLALFGPIVPLLAALAAGIIAVTTPLALLITLFSMFGVAGTLRGFSDMVDALDVPFLDHFTNSIERAIEAYQRFTSAMSVDAGWSGLALQIGGLGAALIAFSESTSDLDFLDGPLETFGETLTRVASAIDVFMDAYERYRGIGKKSDTQQDFGVTDVFDDGEMSHTFTRIQAIRSAWTDFAGEMYKQFPKQRELISQIDGAVGGLLDAIGFAQMGEWDQAWSEFTAAAQSGWDAIQNIAGQVADAFQGIDWGAVASSVGDLLNAAFEGAIDLGEMIVDGAIALGGALLDIAGRGLDWLQEQLGLPEDAGVIATILATIETIANWVGDFADAQGGRFLDWIGGKLGLGPIVGDGTGGPEPGMDLSFGVVVTALITTVVEWAGELVGAEAQGLANWIRDRFLGGGTRGLGGMTGTRLGTLGGGGELDLGEIVASFTINVLEPTLTGWISGAAGWLQGKLQDFVNGQMGGGGTGIGAGIGGTSGTPGIGGGSALVRLAGWAIDVLEPIVNMQAGDIVGLVQREIDSIAEGARFSFNGFALVLQQITGENIEDAGDIPGAIQTFINTTAQERDYIANVLAMVRATVTGVEVGSYGGGTGIGAGIGGGTPGSSGYSGVEAMVKNALGDGRTVEILYNAAAKILNYEITNVPGDVNEAVQAYKETWEIAETWIKEVTLDLRVIMPHPPDFLLDIAEAIKDGPLEFVPGLDSLAILITMWNDIATAADEAKAAQEGAASVQFQPAPSGYVRGATGNLLNVGTGAGGTFATPLPNDYVQPPIPVGERPDPIDIGQPKGSMPPPPIDFVPMQAQLRNQLPQLWTTGVRDFLPTVQQTGGQVSRGFGTSLGTGFAPAIQTATAGATQGFDSGLRPMVGQATAIGGQTVGATGTSLLPLPTQTGAAGVSGANSLRNGIGPMAGYGQTAGSNTTSQTSGALMPLPPILGGIGRTAGQSFQNGIATGMIGAVIAARAGAAGVVAAVNSIGSLYGQGFAIGQSFGQGVYDGLMSMVGAVAAAAATLVATAASAAQARGEMASPSKLFHREVGLPIAQGIAQGMIAGIPEVRMAAEKVLGFTGTDGSYTVPRSKVVAIYNTNQYILEPEEWIAVQRDARMSAQQLRDMNSQARQKQRSKPQFLKAAPA